MTPGNNMDNLEKLFDRYNEFIEFDIPQISERLIKLPAMLGHYQGIYFEVRKRHNKSLIDMDKKWQEKYRYYKIEYSISLNNNEIKTFIERDLEYIDLKERERNLDNVLNRVEQCLKSLDSMSWTLKNLVEWEKFKAGNF